MNKFRVFKQAMLLIGLISMLSTLAYADRDDRDRYDFKGGGDKRERHNNYSPSKNYQGGYYPYNKNQPPPKGYQLDKHYNHNYYYPKPGYSITKVPPGSYNVHYRNSRYYYYGGVWYRPYGGSFIVIAPPIGVYVPTLPAYYTTIYYGGIPYYYANNVYYIWDAGRGSYVVTNPPPQDDIQEQPPLVSDQLYIYPSQGQNEQQQANDRYACHDWGVKQTGYDPTQPPANMSQAELNGRRMDYQRAMKACLEGRGYTVR